MKNNKQKYFVLSIFFFIVIITLFFHMGGNSPYSYAAAVLGSPASKIEGHFVNLDATNLYDYLTPYFYEPSKYYFHRTPNIILPLHTFCTSIILGITRSYMISSYTTNLIFLIILCFVFIKLATKFNISYYAIGLAGINILLLPFFAHYIGQPLQYIVGTVINFLVILIIISLNMKNNKNPIVYGLLIGILTLNYDWYVFGGALLIYFLFYYRFKNFSHYLILILSMITPLIIWRVSIATFSLTPVSSAFYESFQSKMIEGWVYYFKHIVDEFISPFIVSHVGLTIAFKQIIAYIYWPLLFITIYLLIKLKPEIGIFKFNKLIILLLVVYLLEQIFTAAFDFENNTRRAIPVILVFSYAFTYVVSKTINYKNIRYLLYIFTFSSFVLTFSGVLLKNPAVPLIQIGEAIRGNPKTILEYNKSRLNNLSLPKFPTNEKLGLFKFGKAKLATENKGRKEMIKSIYQFVMIQLFPFSIIFLLFYFLSKAKLLHRNSMFIYSGIYLLSIIVRFI